MSAGVPFKRHRAAHKGARFKQEQRRSVARVPDDVARRERRRPDTLSLAYESSCSWRYPQRPFVATYGYRAPAYPTAPRAGSNAASVGSWLNVPNRIPQRLIHVVRQERDGGDGVVILAGPTVAVAVDPREEHLFLVDDAVEFRQVVDEGVVLKLGVQVGYCWRINHARAQI